VNGVPQRKGEDYELAGHELRFSWPLQKEGRLGSWRWMAMFLVLFGTYRKGDCADVQYTARGRHALATGLDILGPAAGR